MTVFHIAGYAAAGLTVLMLAPLVVLPRHVSVERSATLEAAPEAVLALAASNQGYQAFNPYKSEDPDLKIELFGPAQGVGSGFHFDGQGGKGSQTVAEISDTSVTYAIDLGPMGAPTQSIQAMDTDAGTHVVWRVDSDMGFNPVFRVFGLFMEGMMGKVFERGLANLADATV